MDPVLHLTSIFPMARQAQIQALETWHAAHGQPVVSLNHSRECALLRGQLPAWVRLVELRFARRFGGDHVPMSAFAQVARGLSHAGQRVILSLPEIPLACSGGLCWHSPRCRPLSWATPRSDWHGGRSAPF